MLRGALHGEDGARRCNMWALSCEHGMRVGPTFSYGSMARSTSGGVDADAAKVHGRWRKYGSVDEWP
jgi:hypothetical protein